MSDFPCERFTLRTRCALFRWRLRSITGRARCLLWGHLWGPASGIGAYSGEERCVRCGVQDCWHPSGVAPRLTTRWRNLTACPRTLHLGPVEVTVRLLRHGTCGACAGRGWFYTKGSLSPVPRPEGYDSVSLCGCGSGIARLARARRHVRQASKEAPF